MRFHPDFDRLLRVIAREVRHSRRRGTNWRRVHRLFAIGREIAARTGASAPPCAVTIDGAYVTADGMYSLGSDSRHYPLHIPFCIESRAPMRPLRKYAGRATDFGPGALLPVYETVGYTLP